MGERAPRSPFLPLPGAGTSRAMRNLRRFDEAYQKAHLQNDMFAERLKALLAEIQRTFPASCRVEGNYLPDDQIKSAFTVLTAVITSSIAAKVDLGNSRTLAQLIVSSAEPGVPMPSPAVVLAKLESEGVLLKGHQLSDDTTACMTEILNALRA